MNRGVNLALTEEIKVKRTLLLLALTLLVAGCHKLNDGVAGSGNRTKEKRNIGNFTSISSEGAFDIEVVSQTSVSFEIEGDDNLLPLITTEVSNNVLHIKNNRSYSNRKPIIIKISVPILEALSANGAGTIQVTGLKNEKFDLDVNGAPRIIVSGETRALEIDANGAANIDTHKLRADSARVGSNGVSKVEVYAADDLNVTVAGPSRVTYHGNPQVKQDISGPGSVVKKEPSGS